MLVQSTLNDLYLLPAVPRDKWPNGCVKGLRARGGVTVSICWKEGDLHEVGIWSKDDGSFKTLHYRGTSVTVNISSGRTYTFNGELKCMNWRTYALSQRCLFLECKWTIRILQRNYSLVGLSQNQHLFPFPVSASAAILTWMDLSFMKQLIGLRILTWTRN